MLAKLSELLPQIGELFFKIASVLAKGGHLLFHQREALGVGGVACGARFGFRFRLENFHVAGQEMGVTGLLGAGLPRKNSGERGLALH